MSGDTLYVWQEREPDGSWGIIAALIPMLGSVAPLVTRASEIAEQAFGPVARAHQQATQNSVRLAEFKLDIIKEVIHS